MKNLLFCLMAAGLAMTSYAQTPTSLRNDGNVKKVGWSQLRVLSDNQLQTIGKRISATPMPSKDFAATMLKKALAKDAARAKAKASTTNDMVINLATASYTSSDTVYAESWEGWKGEFAWKPESWYVKRTATVSEDEQLCPSWAVVRGDGYVLPYATDGDSYMLCDFTANEQQDEWLVSPAISNISGSNKLFFDLGFAPLYTYLVKDVKIDSIKGEVISCDYDLNTIAYDVEVMITTDTRSVSFDESKYTTVFKLSDIANEIIKQANLDDMAELTKLLINTWHHYCIPLTQYDGGKIRVAFRYTGSNGSFVTLDAVRVSDLLPTAMYDKPEGSMYLGFGFANQYPYLDKAKKVLMPAYTTSVWKNYSNDDCETFSWAYELNSTAFSSADKDLNMQGVEPGVITWPTLTTTGGTRTDTYMGDADVLQPDGSFFKQTAGTAIVGMPTAITYDNGTTVNYGVGNFDPTKPYNTLVGEDLNSLFGTPTSNFWNGSGYTKAVGIANVFDAPASPYVFSSVSLPLHDYLNLGANIVCTVYKAIDKGNNIIEVTDEVLGQTKQSDDDPALGKSGDMGYVLTFNFPNVMVIDSPIAIKISGFDNSLIYNIAPLTQLYNHDSGKGYAFGIMRNDQTQGEWWCELAGLLSSFDKAANMQVSHCISMNATFPYLHSNDGDVAEVNIMGESKHFDINSYWYPAKMDAHDQLNGWTIGCNDAWLKVVPTIDEAAKKAGIDVTAEALPNDMEGRIGTITIKALGCEEVITIKQGEVSGISGVTIDGVTSAKGTYSVSGQRVNSNDARKGLFIENRGGKFVKVLK